MRVILALCVAVVWGSSVFAQAQVSIAMDRLGIADMIAVMHTEGLDYASDLNAEMLGGQGGAVWQKQVAGIYDPDRMSEHVRAALMTLSDSDLRQANVFYGSELGAEVIALELAARRAMLDADLETIARDTYADALERDDPALKAAQIMERSGDMIERNVTGALTANYKFYAGLVDGGVFEMSEDEILIESWAQEDDIRADTTSWLMGYLMLCYQPLAVDDMALYQGFVDSAAGRALNAAIFDGFNKMYSDISYALGRAVALNMEASDL